MIIDKITRAIMRTLLVVLFFAGCLSIFTGIVIMVLKVTQAQ